MSKRKRSKQEGKKRKRMSKRQRIPPETRMLHVPTDMGQEPAVDYSDTTKFLEQELKAKTILLLDAEWLIRFYYENESTSQALVPRRHEILDSALVNLDKFLADEPMGFCSRMVVISYMTLGEDHPDPTKTTLKQVVKALELFRLEFRGIIGVFWDFACLGSLSFLSDEDEECKSRFERGLRHVLPLLYMHPETTVFEVTKHPQVFPPKATEFQRTKYYDRGWTFAEACWASYVKIDSSRIFDISNLTDLTTSYGQMLRYCGENNPRVPPYRPNVFKGLLKERTFSHRGSDLGGIEKIVDDAHTRLFESLFGQMHQLTYERQGWEDKDAEVLFGLLREGHVRGLQRLNLSHNLLLDCFGEKFDQVLKECKLTCLNISGNPIGSDGVAILSKKLFGLRCLRLGEVGLDEHGCRLLAAKMLSAQNEGRLGLRELDLSHNSLGDVGVFFLAPALILIKSVDLQNTHMSDEGCNSLCSCVTERTEQIMWDHLDLRGNTIQFSGALKILRRHCQPGSLHWSDSSLSARSRWQLSDTVNSLPNFESEGSSEDIISKSLESKAVALISARWLIQRAKSGCPLPRRQEIPQSAFLSKEDLERSQRKESNWCHNIIVVSHLWLSKDHPDPLCTTLQLVARGLACCDTEFHCDFGVFWDFASLFQKLDGEPRETELERLFQEGLGAIPSLFMSPVTIVFQVTELPEVPGYRMSGHSALPLFQRGWPFSEHCWSSIKKRYSGSVFDLSKLGDGHSYSSLYNRCATKSRHVPLRPHEFKEKASVLAFGREGDREKVKKLYKDSYKALFMKVESLNLDNISWTNADAAPLLSRFHNKQTPKLVRLNVSKNHLTPRFCSTLSNSILQNKLPDLKEVDISNNPVGDHGVAFLSAVFHKLKRLRMRGVGLTRPGCRMLKSKMSAEVNRKQSSLIEIDLGENVIFDDGVGIVGELFRNTEVLKLASVNCSDEGCFFLARLAANAKWNYIDLCGNRICISGPLIKIVEESEKVTHLLVRKKVTHLLVRKNTIRSRSKEQLEKFCSRKGVTIS